MAQALVNPNILIWARQRAGLHLSELARKLAIKEEKLYDWEAGKGRPSFRQAQLLAHHTHVPFGYLFLHHPPGDELPIPDLRTVGDSTPGEPSLALKDTLREVIQRQLWYREYQQEREAPRVAVVGSFSTQASVADLVDDMRRKLGLAAHPERGRWDDYFRDLVERIEGLGVLVMRNGMVGTNTRRPLSVEEFRGFAIADPYAPVIFINSADVPEARLFTLLHELTHVWLGQSAISDADPKSPHATERLCNQVAAEFLVPEREFVPLWNNDIAWEENLAAVAAQFHVSQWVIARRARELDLIGDEDYGDYLRRRLEAARQWKSDGRPSFQRVQKGRISKRFAQAVASEALSGRLLLRDAHRLTGIRPERIAMFARKELGL